MSAGLHLATAENAETCHGLAEKYHAEIGATYDAVHRAAVIDPLLAGSPLGAIWLIGPPRAPLGYVLITFAWSIEAGGMIGWVREIFVRDKVRKRGIGTEALADVARALRGGGIQALHVTLPEQDQQRGFWQRARFATVSDHRVFTQKL